MKIDTIDHICAQKSRGRHFPEKKKRLRHAHRPRGGWGGEAAHAIVTSYRYTDTLQVYRHPTSIQTPNSYTDTLQVYSTQNTSPDT